MQAINKNASVMRKYGIKELFVAQDLKQLEDVYGQEPELWSNTDCKIFHATGNDRTAKRVTEGYLGKETIEYLVESTQGRGRRSVSPHRVGRPLLTTDEFGQLDPSQLVVLLRGQRPIRMEKYGYDRHYTAGIRERPRWSLSGQHASPQGGAYEALGRGGSTTATSARSIWPMRAVWASKATDS